MSNKLANAIALYMEGIRDGHARRAVEKYTGDRYTQHSTGVRDGVEGFVEFFEPFLERNPEREIRVVRGWEDGRYVFVHVLQSLNGDESEWVTADFFDTDENDRIIEHWDVIAPYSASTPSGHTSIDGPTEITDLDKSHENKAVVRAMIEDLLMPGGNPANSGRYIAEDYIQHNAEVSDGLEPFQTLLTLPNRPLWYHEIVLLVGQGNFVATLCRATWEGVEYAQVDVFRIESGRIVEHWDNAEPVPPPEELVNRGKF
jgi:predicted SnoaL-like aldol condensation-catalyzing enzyme